MRPNCRTRSTRATLSPVEVTQDCLARIGALDAQVNAFCHIDEAATMAMAEDSEARWMAGEPLSPLDGVPVAVKDLLLTKGWPTRRGSLTVDPAGPWNDDAPVVARLREAGAVLIGKTTTPEFGWKGSTDSPLTGITRNPWNLDKTPGGSSGGSSAALAARFCPLALGTDGGGSIRIPASFTATYGIKPSFGRVPAWPLSPFGTVAHVGPMSRTVRDSALLLNVLAQPDARDWHALPYEPENYAADLTGGMKGKRIAYSKRLGYVTKIVPEVEALVEQAAKRFAAMGAEVVEIDPPGGDAGPDLPHAVVGGRGLSARRSAGREEGAARNGRCARWPKRARRSRSRITSPPTQARGAYGAAMRGFMEDYDFLLTPATATPAFDVGKLTPLDDDGNAWMAWTPYSFPFNLTQQPAASINCGFTSDGLPVGLQIVGRMFDDAGVLMASAAYEAADPHFDKVPDGF